MYLNHTEIKKALVIGVEKLSSYVEDNDVGTNILLADGAGAVLLETTKQSQKYVSFIQAEGENNEILTCQTNEKIQMKGTQVYKYAVTKTVENITELLKKANEPIENIKCIIPHQSNKKIMESMMHKLKIEDKKMYRNIENIGNTFCASIPIALDEMLKKGLLQKGDKIILLGYGGGLNTGSILLEI